MPHPVTSFNGNSMWSGGRRSAQYKAMRFIMRKLPYARASRQAGAARAVERTKPAPQALLNCHARALQWMDASGNPAYYNGQLTQVVGYRKKIQGANGRSNTRATRVTPIQRSELWADLEDADGAAWAKPVRGDGRSWPSRP
eukprot:4989392-Amphidinium_carterae.1